MWREIQVVSFTATSVHFSWKLLWIVCRPTDMFFTFCKNIGTVHEPVLQTYWIMFSFSMVIYTHIPLIHKKKKFLQLKCYYIKPNNIWKKQICGRLYLYIMSPIKESYSYRLSFFLLFDLLVAKHISLEINVLHVVFNSFI